MDITEEHFVSRKEYVTYETGIDWFYFELVNFNATVFILEKVAEFPFVVLGEPTNTFFRMVFSNFISSSILSITRLVTDRSKRFQRKRDETKESRPDEIKHTFDEFRQRLEQELVKPEYRQLVKDHLQQLDVCPLDIEMIARVKKFRNAYVAHLGADFVSGETKVNRPDLADLVSIRDILNRQFHILTLKDSPQREMIFPSYSPLNEPSVSDDPRPDIERILDNIAYNNPVLHMPETYPGTWKHDRTVYSKGQLAQINHYRKKFGLPEA